MSVEDGGEIISEVMKHMKAAGEDISSDKQNARIQEAAKDYADNLRLMSAITGKEAKTKMKEAEAQMVDLAWQEKLSKMEPQERIAMQQMLAMMPDSLKLGFKQSQTGSGIVTDQSTRIADQQSGGQIGKMYEAAADASKLGKGAVAAMGKSMEGIAADVQADLKSGKYHAMAVASNAGKGPAGAQTILGQLGAWSTGPKSGQTAEAALGVQGAGKGNKMQQDLNKAQRVGEQLEITIQTKVINNLDIFAAAVAKSSQMLLDKITEVAGTPAEKAALKKRRADEAADEAAEQGKKDSPYIPEAFDEMAMLRGGGVAMQRDVANVAKQHGATKTSGQASDNKAILESAMKEQGITNAKEQAAFMAQMDHETGGFKHMNELGGGKKYEGRKDLGNTQEGDGDKFKGRGYVQLTGRHNYEKYGKMVGADLINNPDSAAQPDLAAKIAIAYWKSTKSDGKSLGEQAQAGNFDAVTRGINGGVNGKSDRDAKFQGYSQQYSAVTPTTQSSYKVNKVASAAPDTTAAAAATTATSSVPSPNPVANVAPDSGGDTASQTLAAMKQLIGQSAYQTNYLKKIVEQTG